jgi:hypothetical protein
VTTAFIAKVGDLIALGVIALFLALRAPQKSQPDMRLSQPFWLWVITVALLDTAARAPMTSASPQR